MKELILLATSAFLFSSTTASFDPVINAIRSGDATELSKYFDNTIEITISGNTKTYSKNQAQVVMRQFFQENAVKDFKVIHESENANSQYCIGSLTTSSGVYRATIFMKQKGDRNMIQEMRFEK